MLYAHLELEKIRDVFFSGKFEFLFFRDGWKKAEINSVYISEYDLCLSVRYWKDDDSKDISFYDLHGVDQISRLLRIVNQ